MESFCVVQVCIRRCNRNNFDDAIFLFAWSLASHVFRIVNLRVSVEPVDIAVVSNVSFVFDFFLEESFNKKKFKLLSLVFCGFTTRWQCRERPLVFILRWAHCRTKLFTWIAQINVSFSVWVFFPVYSMIIFGHITKKNKQTGAQSRPVSFCNTNILISHLGTKMASVLQICLL